MEQLRTSFPAENLKEQKATSWGTRTRKPHVRKPNLISLTFELQCNVIQLGLEIVFLQQWIPNDYRSLSLFPLENNCAKLESELLAAILFLGTFQYLRQNCHFWNKSRVTSAMARKPFEYARKQLAKKVDWDANVWARRALNPRNPCFYRKYFNFWRRTESPVECEHGPTIDRSSVANNDSIVVRIATAGDDTFMELTKFTSNEWPASTVLPTPAALLLKITINCPITSAWYSGGICWSVLRVFATKLWVTLFIVFQSK